MRLIVKERPVPICVWCNNELKKRKKEQDREAKGLPPLPPPWAKKKRKKSGELDVFKEIWAERPHVSEVSGKPLAFDIRCFSHLLTKGAYPKFRLYKPNIMLKTPDEHHTWEFGDTSDSIWDPVKEKKENLKQQYYKTQ